MMENLRAANRGDRHFIHIGPYNLMVSKMIGFYWAPRYVNTGERAIEIAERQVKLLEKQCGESDGDAPWRGSLNDRDD
jgi:hypothetical protein